MTSQHTICLTAWVLTPSARYSVCFKAIRSCNYPTQKQTPWRWNTPIHSACRHAYPVNPSFSAEWNSQLLCTNIPRDYLSTMLPNCSCFPMKSTSTFFTALTQRKKYVGMQMSCKNPLPRGFSFLICISGNRHCSDTLYRARSHHPTMLILSQKPGMLRVLESASNIRFSADLSRIHFLPNALVITYILTASEHDCSVWRI